MGPVTLPWLCNGSSACSDGRQRSALMYFLCRHAGARKVFIAVGRIEGTRQRIRGCIEIANGIASRVAFVGASVVCRNSIRFKLLLGKLRPRNLEAASTLRSVGY
jgi:hypothetical protein